MHCLAVDTEPCGRDHCCPKQRSCLEAKIEKAIGRAFLTAYLLTANIERAESATLQATELWNPDEETGDVLFQNVLEAAARVKIKYAPSHSNELHAAAPQFPLELQRVLRLAVPLRRCFVLRILVGLPVQVCARMLHLRSRQVDQYSRRALMCLGAVDLPNQLRLFLRG